MPRSSNALFLFIAPVLSRDERLVIPISGVAAKVFSLVLGGTFGLVST